MRVRLNTRRGAVAAALVVAASLLFPVASASAEADLAGAGAGAVVTQVIALPRLVTAEISGNIKIVAGIAVLEFACDVVATPDAASTGLDVCSANGVSAIPVPNNIPGAVSAAAGVTTFTWEGRAPELCVEGHAAFVLAAPKSTPPACGNMVVVTNRGVVSGG